MNPSADKNHDKPAQRRTNIGVVVPLMNRSNSTPFRDILSIASSISNRTVVVQIVADKLTPPPISFSNIKYRTIRHCPGDNTLTRITTYLRTQASCALEVARHSRLADVWILYQGETMPLPIIVAKTLRKPTVVVIGGNWDKERLLLNQDTIPRMLSPLRWIALSLATRLIVYSRDMIEEFGLSLYGGKILVARRHIPDTEKFKITVPIRERGMNIGFVGRLSMEKNPVPIIDAIAVLAKDCPEIRLHIAGDGPLRSRILNLVEKESLSDRVFVDGWIDHNRLPEFLNSLRLLVIPSESEGLPNAMLESMACGTPVLARAVGAISEVIADGENGFILQSTDPKVVAASITASLRNPNIDKISENACAIVKSEFSIENIAGRWMEVVSGVIE